MASTGGHKIEREEVRGGGERWRERKGMVVEVPETKTRVKYKK